MAAPRESPAPGLGVRRPLPYPRAIGLVVSGPIARADIPALCERARQLLQESAADYIVCDVGAAEPNAVTLDALARLQLGAKRLGRRLVLHRPSSELCALLALTGLCEVLPVWSGLAKVQGQPEQREQAGGVQKERDPGDAAL